MKKLSIILTIIFLALFGLLHLYLIADTFYIDGADNIHSTREGYGDMPLHLTQISKFAFADHFNLSEPIYYGAKLQYPFLLNMLRGRLLSLTGDWTASVLWPVFFLALANVALLFIIYKKLLKNNGLAVAAFLIFFLGSGLSAWPYVQSAVVGHSSISKFTDTVNREYISTVRLNARYPEQNIAFGAPLSLVFTNQQTFFLGFFGFLSCLYLMLAAKVSPKKSYWLAAGLIFGALPLAHTHSFVAAAAVIFISLLWHLEKIYRPYLKRLFFISAIGIILALPQLFFLLGSKNILNTGADFARFRLGWMMEPSFGAINFPTGERSVFSFSFLNYLWLNFGVVLPLFLLCLALTLIFYRHSKKQNNNNNVILFGLSGLVLFIAVQLIKFQPWDFDNNKLLVYFLFFAAPFIIWFLAHLFRRWRYIQIPAIVIVLMLTTFSGVINLIPPLLTAKDDLPIIFNHDARRMAEFIRSNINEKGLILTSPAHLNPVSSLAGRPVLEGYPGWLWTRGIDYSARDSEIKHFYQSPDPTSQLFAKYPISHILLNNLPDGAGREAFDRLFPRIFEAGDYVLYSVARAPALQ